MQPKEIIVVACVMSAMLYICIFHGFKISDKMNVVIPTFRNLLRKDNMTGAILQVESTGISDDAEDHIEETTKDETLMNSTSWEAGWDAWEKEQERRKGVVRDVCGGTWDQTSQRKKYQKLIKARWNLEHLLVNDENKAIYCYIAKVGCSNWKRMWMILTGASSVTDVNDIVSKKAHEYTAKMQLRKKGIKNDVLIDKLESYTKVIVVRHPIERLISAYLNKIHHEHGTAPFQKQVLPFVKKQRNSANLTNIEWPEFISFVVSSNGRLNEHWRPFNSLCFPCDIKYDVIVKFETIDEDSERFLRKIGAPEHLHFPSRKKIVQSSLVGPYSRNLTHDHITGILKYFGKDFDMFEYDKQIFGA